jgi:hypothetical protein
VVLSGNIVTGFLHGQDGLVQASIETEQTALTIFRLIDAGMAVKGEIYFPKNVLRASLHTFPTGLAAAGIQANIKSFRVTMKGECHFYSFELRAYP